MEALKISTVVVSPADVSRLQRELNALADFFVSAKDRRSGTAMQLPKLTRVLSQIAEENGMNLLEEPSRQKLSDALALIYKDAPTLHISFASEPSPKALDKLVAWIRSNIHPQALVQVGLQPTIAAGCFLRTNNKTFDMSLRATLKKSEPMLVKLIDGAVNGR
jgi:F0F1-type ATP synthase delta subunit